MAENQNSDPVVKTLLISLLGIVVFGFLLSVINGNGINLNGTIGGGRVMYGGHMGYGYGMSSGYGMSGGYGTSIGGVIGGLLVLLVKLLMLILVIVVVVGIVMWVKNTFFQNTTGANTTGTNTGLMQSVNNDPILKTVATIILTILGIMLLLALFNSLTQPGYGFGVNYNAHMGGYNYGFNLSNSMASLLLLVINVLTFVVVISLILAVIAYLKNQYENNNLNQASSGAKNQTAVTPINVNNNTTNVDKGITE